MKENQTSKAFEQEWNNQEWDDVYRFCEALNKKVLIELVMNLASIASSCNNRDVPQEVKKVIKEEISNLVELGAI